MARAIDPRKPYVYISRDDRMQGTQEQTKWMLKPLTASERAQVEDVLVNYVPGKDAMQLRTGSQIITVLRLGLVGVQNFIGADGKPVEFKRKNLGTEAAPQWEVADEFIDLIAPALRRELANEITENASLSEADRGNSLSLPVS